VIRAPNPMSRSFGCWRMVSRTGKRTICPSWAPPGPNYSYPMVSDGRALGNGLIRPGRSNGRFAAGTLGCGRTRSWADQRRRTTFKMISAATLWSSSHEDASNGRSTCRVRRDHWSARARSRCAKSATGCQCSRMGAGQRYIGNCAGATKFWGRRSQRYQTNRSRRQPREASALPPRKWVQF
jgi:hypothetical protein